jgi:hypothetical protein
MAIHRGLFVWYQRTVAGGDPARAAGPFRERGGDEFGHEIDHAGMLVLHLSAGVHHDGEVLAGEARVFGGDLMRTGALIACGHTAHELSDDAAAAEKGSGEGSRQDGQPDEPSIEMQGHQLPPIGRDADPDGLEGNNLVRPCREQGGGEHDESSTAREAGRDAIGV